MFEAAERRPWSETHNSRKLGKARRKNVVSHNVDYKSCSEIAQLEKLSP